MGAIKIHVISIESICKFIISPRRLDVYMGHSHGGGENFLGKTQFFQNCHFCSETKYFFTQLLITVITIVLHNNTLKLQINSINFNEICKMTESVTICWTCHNLSYLSLHISICCKCNENKEIRS